MQDEVLVDQRVAPGVAQPDDRPQRTVLDAAHLAQLAFALGPFVPDDSMGPGVTRVSYHYGPESFRQQPLAPGGFGYDAGDGSARRSMRTTRLSFSSLSSVAARAPGEAGAVPRRLAVQPVHRGAERREVGDHHAVAAIAGAFTGEDLLDGDGRAVRGGHRRRGMGKFERHPHRTGRAG